jgi:hypothetical protein
MRLPFVSRLRYQSAIHQAAKAETALAQERLKLAEREQQCRTAEAEAGQWRAECGRLQGKVESLMDNILWANGQRPIFDPGDERFRRKTAEEVTVSAAQRAKVENPAEMRRSKEKADMEFAERDRKAVLAAQLKVLAEQEKEKKKKETSDGRSNQA